MGTSTIMMLKNFVDAVKSSAEDFLRDIYQIQPILARLCVEAPDVAAAIAAMIYENQIPVPRRKRRRTKDLSYRPPKLNKFKTKGSIYSQFTRAGGDSGGGQPLVLTDDSSTHGNREVVKITTQERPPITALPGQGIVISLAQAIEIVYQLSRYQGGTPTAVHKQILQSLREPAASRRWSDGSAWREVLERGASRSRAISITNLLDLIGASDCYDYEVEKIKLSSTTSDKRASTLALSLMQRAEDQGTEGGLEKRLETNRRLRLLNNLSRGRRVKQLVIELSPGVLFSPQIWTIIKSKKEEFADTIDRVKGDRNERVLLQILSVQLESFVNTGSPDLQAFYQQILDENLLSNDELRAIRVRFGSYNEPLPTGALELALGRLKETIAQDVFGKPTLHRNDTVKIYETELSDDVFTQLQSGKIDRWTIEVAMQISDKLDSVRYYKSVALDESNTQKQAPFSVLAREIAQNELAGGKNLIHFCPVHDGQREHFTLLEINKKERKIRHYDSLADRRIIEGRNGKSRALTLAVEQFHDLQAQEEPTPQQHDGWSCGVRVAYNFRRLANGLPIGPWEESLDPDRMKLEIIEGLLACAGSVAMRKNRCEGKLCKKNVQEEALCSAGNGKSQVLTLAIY